METESPRQDPKTDQREIGTNAGLRGERLKRNNETTYIEVFLSSNFSNSSGHKGKPEETGEGLFGLNQIEIVLLSTQSGSPSWGLLYTLRSNILIVAEGDWII